MRRETDSPNDFPTPAPAGVFLSLYEPSEPHLAFLAEILRGGDIVAVPSETVYGLAANATNPESCEKIFALKRRPSFDPLIVHVRDLEQAEEYAHFSPIARELAGHFWPGPLTLVLPKKEVIPDIVTSGRSTVAVRCPAHPVFRALLQQLDFGLAAPSANPFGYISPTCAEHVADSFGKELPYILDGGPCQIGIESTIVDASLGLGASKTLRILRHGGIDELDLRQFLEQRGYASELLTDGTGGATKGAPKVSIDAPGMLARHYSPRKPLKLLPFRAVDLSMVQQNPDAAFLLAADPHQESGNDSAPPNVFRYLQEETERDPGQHLYRLLREIDAGDWSRIVAELPPEAIRQSAAIRDRLTRAAARE